MALWDSRVGKLAIGLMIVVVALAVLIAVAPKPEPESKVTASLDGTWDYNAMMSAGEIEPMNQADQPAADGTHYMVYFVVMTNNGTEWFNITEDSWSGHLSDGSVIGLSTNFDRTGPNLAAVNVAPGKQNWPLLAFEVPDGLEVQSISYSTPDGSGSLEI